jgi:putative transposase
MYNDALTERRLAWKMNEVSIRYIDQANQLKEIRQFDDDLAFANYSSLQQTLRRLKISYDGFFRRINTGQKAGYPRVGGKNYIRTHFHCNLTLKYGKTLSG